MYETLVYKKEAGLGIITVSYTHLICSSSESPPPSGSWSPTRWTRS